MAREAIFRPLSSAQHWIGLDFSAWGDHWVSKQTASKVITQLMQHEHTPIGPYSDAWSEACSVGAYRACPNHLLLV